MTSDFASGRQPVLPAALTFGFLGAVVTWAAWFITHLPWVGMPDMARLEVILGVWLATMVWAGFVIGRGRWIVFPAAGLVTALLGLLLLGTKLAPHAGQDQPSAALVVVGFLGLGVVVGFVGGIVGFWTNKGKGALGGGDWLARFSLVAVATAVPLIVVGGLVTSTNSGMAVPDWPGTYGHNMFLFPLTGAAPVPDKPYEQVFLEHSHRLFGSLLGATTLTLLVWTLVVERRRWVKVWVGSVFAAVVVQGVIGGLWRVGQNSVAGAVVHGILAQLTVAGLVAVAVVLWATPARLEAEQPFPNPRRPRVFTAAALHSSIVQLILGALYRQLRDAHALISHIVFSFVVLIAGMMGGFVATAVPREAGPLSRTLRRLGMLLVGVVLLQFLLGWATLGAGGKEREAASVGAALLRTSHQANGALLLATATAASVLATLLHRQFTRKGEPAAATAESVAA